MATKKVGSTAKKTSKKSTVSKPSTTTTKVSTIRAVETKPAVVTAPRRSTNARTALVAALIGEFIGTFVLTSAFIITKGEPLYLGFTLVAIVLMIATLSGAHVNPLLTVGAWVTRKINSLRAIGYIVAQILGAVAALGLLTAFIGGAPQQDANSQAAMLGQSSTPELFKIAALTTGKEWYVFFAELVGATLFAFAVATAAREGRDRVARAFGIGFGLFIAALLAGVAASYVSGNAVINPAIALTVGAIDWAKLNFLAVAAYLIAPLIGGVLGFAVSDALHNARAKDEA